MNCLKTYKSKTPGQISNCSWKYVGVTTTWVKVFKLIPKKSAVIALGWRHGYNQCRWGEGDGDRGPICARQSPDWQQISKCLNERWSPTTQGMNTINAQCWWSDRGDPICEQQSAKWRQIPQSEHRGKHTLCTVETANLVFANGKWQNLR